MPDPTERAAFDARLATLLPRVSLRGVMDDATIDAADLDTLQAAYRDLRTIANHREREIVAILRNMDAWSAPILAMFELAQEGEMDFHGDVEDEAGELQECEDECECRVGQAWNTLQSVIDGPHGITRTLAVHRENQPKLVQEPEEKPGP